MSQAGFRFSVLFSWVQAEPRPWRRKGLGFKSTEARLQAGVGQQWAGALGIGPHGVGFPAPPWVWGPPACGAGSKQEVLIASVHQNQPTPLPPGQFLLRSLGVSRGKHTVLSSHYPSALGPSEIKLQRGLGVGVLVLCGPAHLPSAWPLTSLCSVSPPRRQRRS